MIRGHHLQELVDANLAPSVRWLQDGIRAKAIPATKIGRHWVMTEADVEEFLAARRSMPAKAEEIVRPLSLTATSLRRQAS